MVSTHCFCIYSQALAPIKLTCVLEALPCEMPATPHCTLVQLQLQGQHPTLLHLQPGTCIPGKLTRVLEAAAADACPVSESLRLQLNSLHMHASLPLHTREAL